jgi:3-oxoacyl-[acyl-carrier-protein] synthase-3
VSRDHSPTAHLSALAYELGEREEAVADLDAIAGLEEALLRPAGGFVSYWSSDVSACELALPAAARSLATSGLAEHEVDAVVFASDSLPDEPGVPRALQEFLQELGLDSAWPVRLSLMDCATALVAVACAASLVQAGTCRNVLVVATDLAWGVGLPERIVPGGHAVASDAAATALVSAGGGGFEIVSSAFEVDATLHDPELPPQRRLLTRLDVHRRAFATLWTASGYGPKDVARVLPSNFSPDVLDGYLGDAGFDRAQVHLDNVPRTAHCLGSDPLINLADHIAGGTPERLPGGLYVLFGLGVSQAAAVLLHARTPASARTGS